MCVNPSQKRAQKKLLQKSKLRNLKHQYVNCNVCLLLGVGSGQAGPSTNRWISSAGEVKTFWLQLKQEPFQPDLQVFPHFTEQSDCGCLAQTSSSTFTQLRKFHQLDNNKKESGDKIVAMSFSVKTFFCPPGTSRSHKDSCWSFRTYLTFRVSQQLFWASTAPPLSPFHQLMSPKGHLSSEQTVVTQPVLQSLSSGLLDDGVTKTHTNGSWCHSQVQRLCPRCVCVCVVPDTTTGNQPTLPESLRSDRTSQKLRF